jgi:hypothetical protein
MNTRKDNPLIGKTVTIDKTVGSYTDFYLERGFQNYSYIVQSVYSFGVYGKTPRYAAVLLIKEKIADEKVKIESSISYRPEGTFKIELTDLVVIEEGNRYYTHLLTKLED